MIEPRLEIMERAIDTGDYARAFDETIKILAAIQSANGRINGIRWVPADKSAREQDQATEFSTRFSAAFGQMICLHSFTITFSQFEQLQQYNRWIELMVSLSGFGSYDSFIRRLGADKFDLDIEPKDLLRFFCLYTPSSRLDFPFEALYHGNNVAFLITALGWLGSRYCFTERFFNLREKLLAWIPEKLSSGKTWRNTLGSVTEPFFHSSYALLPEKHTIKRNLITQLRSALLEFGCQDFDVKALELKRSRRSRPVILVSAEYLNVGHSIFRTHSRAVRSLKARFHTIGLIPKDHASQDVKDLFDEVMHYPETGGFFAGVRDLSVAIQDKAPDIVLHLGIGMRGHVIGLSALKLAPITMHSHGHMATTNNDILDYHILPGDFVGEDKCFSEKIIKLDQDAMPYEQRRDVNFSKLRDDADAVRTDDVIRIGIPGTVMKLNPVLFDTLRKIREHADKPVQFEFFPGFAVGLPHALLDRSIRAFIPDAIINAELPYDQYCQEMAKCHFTLSPFPYGNLNTVIESVALGLPGICLDGPESHSHADGALYQWLVLPSELNVNLVEAYINAAVRLINDRDWRLHCRDLAKKAPLKSALYDGHEEKFCDAVFRVFSDHQIN